MQLVGIIEYVLNLGSFGNKHFFKGGFWLLRNWTKDSCVAHYIMIKIMYEVQKFKLASFQVFSFWVYKSIVHVFLLCIYEGAINVWLQVDLLSCVYLFVVCLHFVPFNILHPSITQVIYGVFETPIRFQILVFFFPQPPPHCLLSIWTLSMLKHSTHHPIMILYKLCWRGNTRLLTLLSFKSILKAL